MSHFTPRNILVLCIVFGCLFFFLPGTLDDSPLISPEETAVIGLIDYERINNAD